MPLFQTIQGNETFIAKKEFVVNGVLLREGEYLPENNEIRQDWRRLEVLIKTRYLALVGIPAATIKAPTQAGVPEKPLPKQTRAKKSR